MNLKNNSVTKGEIPLVKENDVLLLDRTKGIRHLDSTDINYAPCLVQLDSENFRFLGVDLLSPPSHTEHRCGEVFQYQPFSVRRQSVAGYREQSKCSPTTAPSEQVFLPTKFSQLENPFQKFKHLNFVIDSAFRSTREQIASRLVGVQPV